MYKRIVLLVLIILGGLFVGQRAFAGSADIFTLSGEPGNFNYEYVGENPAGFPQGVNMCWSLEEDPWFHCGWYPEPGWISTTLPLSDAVYYVGSGGPPISYTLTPEIEELGWAITDAGDGVFYTPPQTTWTAYLPLVGKTLPVVEFTLIGVGDAVEYHYTGSAQNWPHFLNYCRGLPADPWFECNTLENPQWISGSFFVVPADWYFIGSGGQVLYNNQAQGWSLTPSNDGFSKD